MYFIQVINLFLISVCRQIFSFIIIYKFLSNGLLQGICACLNSAIWRPIANIRISIHELKWNVLSPMSRRFYHVERWNPDRQGNGRPAQDNAPAGPQDDRKRRTPGLLVRRLSHAQIGAVSAPICAFYHRSLGGFSLVSVQPCPLFSDSGSKVGQNLFASFFQCRNVICQCIPYRENINRTVSASIAVSGAIDDAPRNRLMQTVSAQGCWLMYAQQLIQLLDSVLFCRCRFFDVPILFYIQQSSTSQWWLCKCFTQISRNYGRS